MDPVKIDYNDLIRMLWNHPGSWTISLDQDGDQSDCQFLRVECAGEPTKSYRIDKSPNPVV